GLVGLKPSRGRIPSGLGLLGLAGLAVPGPLARTVSDAALLLDALVDGVPSESATAAPRLDGGAYLNAAIRGEGRFQLGVTTSSPWETAYQLELAPEAQAALDLARSELDGLGHGVEEFRLAPEDDYAAAFRTIWQAGA